MPARFFAPTENAATGKMLLEKLDAPRADALIGSAIKELPSRLN